MNQLVLAPDEVVVVWEDVQLIMQATGASRSFVKCEQLARQQLQLNQQIKMDKDNEIWCCEIKSLDRHFYVYYGQLNSFTDQEIHVCSAEDDNEYVGAKCKESYM
jgi:hypothetical protein